LIIFFFILKIVVDSFCLTIKTTITTTRFHILEKANALFY